LTINRSELKQAAKDSLRGKWGIAIGICVVYFILIESMQLANFFDFKHRFDGFALILFFVLYLAYCFSIPALIMGFIKVFLRISRNQATSLMDLFDGFSIYWKAFGLHFTIGFYTLLWSLLLIIPGIIATISYSMAYYIMADNHNIEIMDAIKESKRITYGHKGDIFVLGLSFIGWGLLSCLTLGIGFLWLAPYIATTYSNLYNKLSDTPEIVDNGDYIPAT